MKGSWCLFCYARRSKVFKSFRGVQDDAVFAAQDSEVEGSVESSLDAGVTQKGVVNAVVKRAVGVGGAGSVHARVFLGRRHK